MFVEFKKNHPSGIHKGHSTKVDDVNGVRWIKEGYCKEIEEEKHMEYVELLKKEAKEHSAKLHKAPEPARSTLEENKNPHMEILNAMDMDGLTAYIKVADLEVEIEAEATIEDVVTLIDLAEEKKKE